ncbi:Rpn family recombination-promoting nuclease/putative transposase [Vitiosangium sp. GDMCC 1.1324]|uniref:Rpn family recombination-promoting nuclease/putative transposase n=1 Tax=Vitiosangium sp. (strain GDMCC 1.1324) TaxID=2138576 RepID=UPI000D3AA638|nr:Rpn family recombination-promoting nuclease/putative transposase [Vitiosangium sp. GDMCC 1.1324]PTL82945.1 transposase [Vitiosangium sp. GDMCC 1.1324]
MSGPHDLFVRFTLGHPERAAAELRAVLPPDIVSRVDWSTLRREPGSVVDPELRETQSDLLFSARLRSGQELLLYILLEHQSSVDKWMALRMLRYVVRQAEHWRKEHPESERLPVIVPLVMYHGPDGAWTAPRRVEDLFELPDESEERERWRTLVPHFEFLLDDLTAERAEGLMARPGPPLARLALLVLRYGRSEELSRRLASWTALFAEVHAAPDGLENLRVVVRYLFQVGDEAARESTEAVLRSVAGAQRTEELMMTVGEKLIEKGRQEGRLEGRLEGRAEDILRILTARGIHVDDKTRGLIMACRDPALLEQWFDRALTASSISDVTSGG